MALEKKVDLKIKANQIQTETIPLANSCLRNGIMLNNIIDSTMGIFGLVRADLDTLRLANTIDQRTEYVLVDAVGSTKTLQLRAATSNATEFNAVDLFGGTTGIYDITADTYTLGVTPFSISDTVPTITDDADAGYQAGYIVQVANIQYLCLDPTNGAADWRKQAGLVGADWVPNVTPDGVCMLSATSVLGWFYVENDICEFVIRWKSTCDFNDITGASAGNASFDLPIASSAEALADVTMKLQPLPLTPINAFYDIGAGGIGVQCDDTTYSEVIYFTVKGSYPIVP